MAKPLQSLLDKATRLKERGKLTEAITVYRQAIKQYPDSGVAEHNLAGALGDGRWAMVADPRKQNDISDARSKRA